MLSFTRAVIAASALWLIGCGTIPPEIEVGQNDGGLGGGGSGGNGGAGGSAGAGGAASAECGIGLPVCDDSNECTTDACVDGACGAEPISGTLCLLPYPDDAGLAVCSMGVCRERCIPDPCAVRACFTSVCTLGLCEFTPSPAGEVCAENGQAGACDGAGVCNVAAPSCSIAGIPACSTWEDCPVSQEPDAVRMCINGCCVFSTGIMPPCDDGNECTDDTFYDGACHWDAVTYPKPCGDGGACWVGSCCDKGMCWDIGLNMCTSSCP